MSLNSRANCFHTHKRSLTCWVLGFLIFTISTSPIFLSWDIGILLGWKKNVWKCFKISKALFEYQCRWVCVNRKIASTKMWLLNKPIKMQWFVGGMCRHSLKEWGLYLGKKPQSIISSACMKLQEFRRKKKRLSKIPVNF